MVTATEVEESLASKSTLMQGDRFNKDRRSAQKCLSLAGSIRPSLTVQHDRKLEVTDDADAADFRIEDQLCEVLCLWLPEENRYQGRSIKNHLGSPCSS